MVQVQQWLASAAPYPDGVELLKKLGKPSSTLLVLLEEGETTYSRSRLLEALQAITDDLVEVAAAERPAPRTSTEGPDRVLYPDKDVIPIEAYPPELQAVRKLVWPLREEQVALHARLETTADASLRLQMAKRIMEIERERQRHWRRLDHWRDHGVDLMAEKPAPAHSAQVYRVALEKRRRTLWTYRSRYMKAVPDKWAPYAVELAAIEAQLNAVQQG